MKQVLIYSNRKIDLMVWDVSTSKQEDAAYKALFKILDDEWDCYTDIDDTSRLKKLYTLAKAGNIQAMKDLMDARDDYEYESFSIVNVEQDAEETTSM